VRSVLIGAALLVASCGRCGGEAAPASGGAATPKPSEPAKPSTGIVSGIVRLAPGATLPSYTVEQMEKQVLTQAERAKPPEACSPPKLNDRTPVALGDDGALIGVVIAASGFSKPPSARPPQTLEVQIVDCRLTPKIVLAQVGDTLRVRNQVDYPFMPAYGAVDTVKTLIPGQTYDVVIDKPGVATVACGFTSPCGRTDVVTLQHTFAALSDDKGGFRFDTFPADEPITLSAWHPAFQEATVEVVVGAGEDKRVELVLTPAPQAAAPVAPAPVAPAPGKEATPSRSLDEATKERLEVGDYPTP
jgi:hypothetical protein